MEQQTGGNGPAPGPPFHLVAAAPKPKPKQKGPCVLCQTQRSTSWRKHYLVEGTICNKCYCRTARLVKQQQQPGEAAADGTERQHHAQGSNGGGSSNMAAGAHALAELAGDSPPPAKRPMRAHPQAFAAEMDPYRLPSSLQWQPSAGAPALPTHEAQPVHQHHLHHQQQQQQQQQQQPRHLQQVPPLRLPPPGPPPQQQHQQQHQQLQPASFGAAPGGPALHRPASVSIGGAVSMAMAGNGGIGNGMAGAGSLDGGAGIAALDNLLETLLQNVSVTGVTPLSAPGGQPSASNSLGWLLPLLSSEVLFSAPSIRLPSTGPQQQQQQQQPAVLLHSQELPQQQQQQQQLALSALGPLPQHPALLALLGQQPLGGQQQGAGMLPSEQQPLAQRSVHPQLTPVPPPSALQQQLAHALSLQPQSLLAPSVEQPSVELPMQQQAPSPGSTLGKPAAAPRGFIPLHQQLLPLERPSAAAAAGPGLQHAAGPGVAGQAAPAAAGHAVPAALELLQDECWRVAEDPEEVARSASLAWERCQQQLPGALQQPLAALPCARLVLPSDSGVQHPVSLLLLRVLLPWQDVVAAGTAISAEQQAQLEEAAALAPGGLLPAVRIAVYGTAGILLEYWDGLPAEAAARLDIHPLVKQPRWRGGHEWAIVFPSRHGEDSIRELKLFKAALSVPLQQLAALQCIQTGSATNSGGSNGQAGSGGDPRRVSLLQPLQQMLRQLQRQLQPPAPAAEAAQQEQEGNPPPPLATTIDVKQRLSCLGQMQPPAPAAADSPGGGGGGSPSAGGVEPSAGGGGGSPPPNAFGLPALAAAGCSEADSGQAGAACSAPGQQSETSQQKERPADQERQQEERQQDGLQQQQPTAKPAQPSQPPQQPQQDMPPPASIAPLMAQPSVPLLAFRAAAVRPTNPTSTPRSADWPGHAAQNAASAGPAQESAVPSGLPGAGPSAGSAPSAGAPSVGGGSSGHGGGGSAAVLSALASIGGSLSSVPASEARGAEGTVSSLSALASIPGLMDSLGLLSSLLGGHSTLSAQSTAQQQEQQHWPA